MVLNDLKLLQGIRGSHRLSPKAFVGANLLLAPAAELADLCRALAGDNALIRFSPPAGSFARIEDDEDFYENIAAKPSLDAALSPQICGCPGFAAFRGTAAEPGFWSSLLDGRGFLNSTPEEAASSAGIGVEAVARFIKNLQEYVEPAGLFAAGLGESLLIQLKRGGHEGTAAWRLLAEGSEALIGGLAEEWGRARGLGAGEIESALRLLRSLDPAPGKNFSPPSFTTPDIEFVLADGGIRPRLIVENMPRVDNCFAEFENFSYELLREKWLRGEWRAAKDTLKKLGMRYRTLLRAASHIASAQREKIMTPSLPPKPLTYREAAAALALHTSTLYRAMQNTGCLINGRSYPMRIFFSRAAAAEKEMSVASLRAEIAPLRAKGLTNREIGERLGLPTRTVAWHSAKIGARRGEPQPCVKNKKLPRPGQDGEESFIARR